MIEDIKFTDEELEWVDERPVDYELWGQLFGVPVVPLDDSKGRTYQVVEASHERFKDMIRRGLLRE